MPAFITEIFSSTQGEGPYAGCLQIFLRLAGCNLNCRYCDTPAPKAPDRCRVEETPGRRDFRFVPNPISEAVAAGIIHSYEVKIHHSISITGGEPLLHPGFIRKVVPLLHGSRHGIYLETNGTLPGELSRVVDYVDIIAMDIKLPSVSKLPPMWDEHRRFLEVAAQKKVFVKIVVGEETTDEEIEKVALLIQGTSPGIPLIIQPVSPNGGIRGVYPGRLLDLQVLALRKLADVRVIPQTHKITGQL